MSVSVTKVVNFGPAKGGLATVGYKVDGGTRVTSGVAELGTNTGVYAASVSLAEGRTGHILWDTGEGSPAYAGDEYSTLPVPLPLWAGSCSAGSQSGCTLASGPGYDVSGATVVVYSGAGAGQTAVVRSYNTGTGAAVFAAPVLVALDNTSKVRLYFDAGDPGQALYVGYAAGGDVGYVTLGSGKPASLPTPYAWVSVEAGPGAGCVFRATAYNSGTGVVTVDGVFPAAPTAASFVRVYEMSPGVSGTNLDKSGYSAVLTATGLDAITVETGVNMRQAMSPVLASAAGQISGVPDPGVSGTVVVKNPGGTAARITADVDEAGNRTAVVLNLPA